jgi:hypothetical protein
VSTQTPARYLMPVIVREHKPAEHIVDCTDGPWWERRTLCGKVPLRAIVTSAALRRYGNPRLCDTCRRRAGISGA